MVNRSDLTAEYSLLSFKDIVQEQAEAEKQGHQNDYRRISGGTAYTGELRIEENTYTPVAHYSELARLKAEDIAAQQHEEEIQARFDSFPDYI